MTIYLDENLSEHVALALNNLNTGYFNHVQVKSTKHHFGKGKPDEEIIPAIGKEEAILITKDLRIKTSRLQYELCKQYKLGVFFIDLPKGEDKHWEMVKTLIYHWEEIVDISSKDKRPFAYRIRRKSKMSRM